MLSTLGQIRCKTEQNVALFCVHRGENLKIHELMCYSSANDSVKLKFVDDSKGAIAPFLVHGDGETQGTAGAF